MNREKYWNVFWNPESKERAIELLTKYFEYHGCGECIMQSDDSLIEAPEVLSEIADKILIEGKGLIHIENA